MEVDVKTDTQKNDREDGGGLSADLQLVRSMGEKMGWTRGHLVVGQNIL